VRYRLAPANRHPARAEDVAAAVGYLIKHADE
jgi:acetyl esterase/lipase